MKKIIFLASVLCILFSSCAENKELKINNEKVIVEPYGWANQDVLKNDSVVYQISPGNVALSIIFCETIVIPIYLTGWKMYEPVKTKKK